MTVRCTSSRNTMRLWASSWPRLYQPVRHPHSTSRLASSSPQPHTVAHHIHPHPSPPTPHHHHHPTTTPSDPLTTQINTLRTLLSRRSRILALTGAGISTESGIPDYRSPGRPPHNPITHQAFMRSETVRKRYWARSMVGYHRMQAAQPNGGHVALAAAQRSGRVHHIVTQNVDGLHEKAGATHVVHLHGNIDQVQCQQCRLISSRSELQRQLEELNPAFAQHVHQLLHQATLLYQQQMAQQQHQPHQPDHQHTTGHHTPLSPAALIPHNHDEDAPPDPTKPSQSASPASPASLRPDGDIELQNEAYYATMAIPACDACGGVLKPDVVFFGANVARDVHEAVDGLLGASDAVLVVGTSLTVWSAFRIIKAALARTHPMDASAVPAVTTLASPLVSSHLDVDSAARSSCLVGIINDGPTRADTLITSQLRIAGRAGVVLQQLFEQ